MTFRRLVAIIGFCFMLVATAIVFHIFSILWVTGEDHIVLYVDLFHERTLELWIIFLGYCIIPVTIYEVDDLLRQAG